MTLDELNAYRSVRWWGVFLPVTGDDDGVGGRKCRRAAHPCVWSLHTAARRKRRRWDHGRLSGATLGGCVVWTGCTTAPPSRGESAWRLPAAASGAGIPAANYALC
ncbi:hypothetical protein KCP70_19205 [Salmonella enterica subsp. enterica]|nr:hypothetical protein KCP70_19205 [Salmonella enterica subsp. enterica]